jgi:hypothetical protein
VTAADLADATVMGGSQSRLPHPRVEPEATLSLPDQDRTARRLLGARQ